MDDVRSAVFHNNKHNQEYMLSATINNRKSDSTKDGLN